MLQIIFVLHDRTQYTQIPFSWCQRIPIFRKQCVLLCECPRLIEYLRFFLNQAKNSVSNQGFVEPDHLLVCVEPVLHLAIFFVAIHILHRSAHRPVQFLVLLRGDVQNLRGQFSKGILPIVQT